MLRFFATHDSDPVTVLGPWVHPSPRSLQMRNSEESLPHQPVHLSSLEERRTGTAREGLV